LGQISLGFGDVHFSGFEGERFDFQGEPNKFYNVISDFNLQVNAYFRRWNNTNGTVMERIGFKIGTRMSNYTLLEMDEYGLTMIDGCELKEKRYFPLGVKNYQGYVEVTDQFEGYGDDIPDIRNAGTFEGACMLVNIGNYKFKVVLSSEPVSSPDEDPYFVNLVSEIKGKNLRPHGIVGQTADFDGKPRIPTDDQGGGIIEGTYQDYEVSSLFADDFKFNRFGKSLRKYTATPKKDKLHTYGKSRGIRLVGKAELKYEDVPV